MPKPYRTPKQQAYDKRRAKAKNRRESRERTSRRLRGMAQNPWGCALPLLGLFVFGLVVGRF